MHGDVIVTIKLFSGIEKELHLYQYDPAEGIQLSIRHGKRLRTILKTIGIKNLSRLVFFRNGRRIGLWSKVYGNDEISCLKPAGGG